MASNCFCFEGSIVSDVREIKDGAATRVIVDSGRGDKARGTFADYAAFGHEGKFLLKYGRKGARITVMGSRLEEREYTTKDGEVRTTIAIAGGHVKLPRGDGGGSDAGAGSDDGEGGGADGGLPF